MSTSSPTDTDNPERDWRRWGVPAIVVATMLGAGIVVGLFIASNHHDVARAKHEAVAARRTAIENRERIERIVREFDTTTSPQRVQELVRILERLTGAQDAGDGSQSSAQPAPSSTPERSPSRTFPALLTPHPTSKPGRPGPHPTPSPGTLKPVLCSLLGEDTMASIGVDCHRDTFVVCDISGLDCPAPPKATVPSTTVNPKVKRKGKT